MRAILDANLLIRFLLPSDNPNRSVDVIMRAGLAQAFTLVTSAELRREVIDSARSKPQLRTKLSTVAAAAVMADIETFGELLPTMLTAPPQRCRDPRDDYLLAYADIGQVDFLVTDDKDLLVLDGQFPFRMVTPGDFVGVLRERGSA